MQSKTNQLKNLIKENISNFISNYGFFHPTMFADYKSAKFDTFKDLGVDSFGFSIQFDPVYFTVIKEFVDENNVNSELIAVDVLDRRGKRMVTVTKVYPPSRKTLSFRSGI